MLKILIRDETKEVVATGLVPEHWGEVPLSAFLADQRLVDKGRTTPGVLALLSGIDEKILLADVSLCVPLWNALDWFRTTLPTSTTRRSFVLGGITYEHAGNMGKLSAGQFEALADFIRMNAANPVLSAPELLAVLYLKQGEQPTPDAIEASAAAFLGLSMDIAYPAMQDFLRTGASAAFSFRMYSDLAPKAAQLLTTLDHISRSSGASNSFFRKSQQSLLRMWTRSVRKML